MSIDVPNMVDVINERINDFVQLPENRPLKAATGYFSTPFRGNLFGRELSDEVARCLKEGAKVDTLWLGTNPCVEESLQFIVDPPKGKGLYPSFLRQISSEYFGARKWNTEGQPRDDWNPIQKPTGNWVLYQLALSKITQPEAVAFANFIPWGSKVGKDLLAKLNPDRLRTML